MMLCLVLIYPPLLFYPLVASSLCVCVVCAGVCYVVARLGVLSGQPPSAPAHYD